MVLRILECYNFTTKTEEREKEHHHGKKLKVEKLNYYVQIVILSYIERWRIMTYYSDFS